MEEKDIEKMTDEELKEYIKKFYEKLENQNSCATCPAASCPRHLIRVNEEDELLENEE